MDDFKFDLYDALELQPDAGEEDIKRAYRRLALLHHPDRNHGEESELFLRLKTSYDVLSDPDRRRNYDAFHRSKEFVRDRRPLTAKEAAWLVDQQKRAWGVKEIHPFAVCILCESCPCPADGVCYACGMTFCQMCVRRMHCNGKTQPHYPCRNSNAFSEKLEKETKEKEREQRLLKAPDNQWLMADEEFRYKRDVYRERAKRNAPELCQYWAWGQTKYTVHIAAWLASEDCEADLAFSLDEDGRQRIRIQPTGGLPPMLDRCLAHRVDEARAGDALFFKHMHCMTFCLAKAVPGERWRKLFDDDSEGARELPLGDACHAVSEEQVDGFKPVHHSRVAGRIETASEWHEVTVSVPLPEAAERRHVNARISATAITVEVDGWLEWRRGLQQRVLTWEDKHESRTHVDVANSTWLLATDDQGRKCVQFVLAQWMEGANRSQEDSIRRQLASDGLRFLTEDADPLHMFDLVECEMWLRAGAVFKRRSELSKGAESLLEEMERHEEREGRGKEALRQSPMEDMWLCPNEDVRLTVRDEEGGEVESASDWWRAASAQETSRWCEKTRAEQEEENRRRQAAAAAAAEAEERAGAAAAARREEEERQANTRRRQLLREQRAMAAARASTQQTGGEFLEQVIGVAEAREAAAAAARANPPMPKKLEAQQPDALLSSSDTAITGAAGTTHSLNKCGYWFEDNGDMVKVVVPLADACAGSALTKEMIACTFDRTSFRLVVRVADSTHVLALPEVAYMIDSERCHYKVRPQSKRVAILLAKQDTTKLWRKLTPL